jgi:hypothetical protein
MWRRRSAPNQSRSEETPTLQLPLRLRGHDGRVDVYYGENQDPSRWGFDLLNLPFDIELTRGFPTCEARVMYPIPGYRAAMGWIQLVTVRDAATGEESTSIDVFPNASQTESPFAVFGFAPTMIDAPGPNPPRANETWTAETFLAVCPDVARSRRAAALLGFRWGYTLRDMRATPFAAEQTGPEAWNGHLEYLREQFPTWEFVPGFAEL